jgi:hypothetical protein
MAGVIFNKAAHIGRRYYRGNEFAELPADMARALANAGTARYADGRQPDSAMVNPEGREVRAFDLPFTPRGK